MVVGGGNDDQIDQIGDVVNDYDDVNDDVIIVAIIS